MYAVMRTSKESHKQTVGSTGKKRKARKKYDQDYNALPKNKQATTFCKRKDGVIKKLIQLGLLIPKSDFYCVIRNANGAQYCAFSKRYKDILKLVSLIDEAMNNKIFSDVVGKVDTVQKYYRVCNWIASFIRGYRPPNGVTKQRKMLKKQLLEKKLVFLKKMDDLFYNGNNENAMEQTAESGSDTNKPVRFWTNAIDKYICNYNFFSNNQQDDKQK